MADSMEDGEIIDSEEDISVPPASESIVSNEQNTAAQLEFCTPRTRSPTANAGSDGRQDATYRNTGQGYSSSEENYSDEEDSFLWKRKKLRYKASVRDKPFVNPLLEQKKENSNLSSNQGVSDQEKGTKRKKNNIWGSVVSEQTLVQTLCGVDVKVSEAEKIRYDDRNVENYDFTLKAHDPRESLSSYDDMDKEVENEAQPSLDDAETFGIAERMQRKRPREVSRKSVKERLGQKDSDSEQRRPVKERLGKRVENIDDECTQYIEVSPSDSLQKVVNALVVNMKEPNVKLLADVVECIGNEKAIKLMHDAESVEAQGGMMTMDMSRRRTMGGVYFQLLKQEQDVDAAALKKIFAIHNPRTFAKAKRRKQKKKPDNFIDSLNEYKTAREEIKEEETIDKILKNENVEIEEKGAENNIETELGEVPDIEIG